MMSLVLTLVLAPALATGQDARAPDTAPVARDTLDLAALQRAAVEGDPRLRRVALQEAATELRLRTLSAERLPTLAVTGEAIHQSEVAGIPIALPNAESPAPPADRWEAALNTDWLLYDGGSIAARRDLEHAELATARAELTAELYPLRMEVAGAYFGALVLQEQLREMAALVEDLEARFTQVREHVAAGAALPADTAAVLAELLRARQQVDEVAAHRRASLAVLRELTAVPVTETDVLTVPDLSDPVARARHHAT